jgi:hypothetical protein
VCILGDRVWGAHHTVCVPDVHDKLPLCEFVSSYTPGGVAARRGRTTSAYFAAGVRITQHYVLVFWLVDAATPQLMLTLNRHPYVQRGRYILGGGELSRDDVHTG